MKGYMVSSKYNYKEKFARALEQGNIKYIKLLIKRGAVIPFGDDNKQGQ